MPEVNNPSPERCDPKDHENIGHIGTDNITDHDLTVAIGDRRNGCCQLGQRCTEGYDRKPDHQRTYTIPGSYA